MAVQCSNVFESSPAASAACAETTQEHTDDPSLRFATSTADEVMGYSEDMNFNDWLQKLVLKNNYEQYCREASNAIRTADVFLLCTGAGFSADSGLAVFADVARVKPYADQGLRYQDLCQPEWLHSYPELFWGFWGQCFNDYRNTGPHEGYRIIDGWAERLFRNNPVGSKIRETCKMFRAARQANIHPSRIRSLGDRALPIFNESGVQGLFNALFGGDLQLPGLNKMYGMPTGIFSSSSSSSPSSDVPSSKSLDSSANSESGSAGSAPSERKDRDRSSPDRAAEATSCTSMPDDEDDEEEEASSEDDCEPYKVKDAPGGFFAFTSNIDAHHYDAFRACEIRECHGNTELYQCGRARPCSHRVWRAPRDHRFQVDFSSMLAPATEALATSKRELSDPSSNAPSPKRARKGYSEASKDNNSTEISPCDSTASTVATTTATPTETVTEPAAAAAAAAATAAEASAVTTATTTAAAAAEAVQGETITAGMPALVEESTGDDSAQATPRIGRVRGVQRQDTLRYMPPPTRRKGTGFSQIQTGFELNHPTCQECGGPARPAILMFMDLNWEDVESQCERWEEWLESVRLIAKTGVKEQEDGPARPLRVAILEVGAGDNVPTVRRTSEKCCKMLSTAGAEARLIRVNPEIPLSDEEPGGIVEESTISILSTGLKAIRDLDRRIFEARGL